MLLTYGSSSLVQGCFFVLETDIALLLRPVQQKERLSLASLAASMFYTHSDLSGIQRCLLQCLQFLPILSVLLFFFCLYIFFIISIYFLLIVMCCLREKGWCWALSYSHVLPHWKTLRKNDANSCWVRQVTRRNNHRLVCTEWKGRLYWMTHWCSIPL